MVVVATGMTTLALAFYAATHLGINSDNVGLISKDLDTRRNHEAFAALFPNLEHALLIVVEGETPELARDAADELTAGFWGLQLVNFFIERFWIHIGIQLLKAQ